MGKASQWLSLKQLVSLNLRELSYYTAPILCTVTKEELLIFSSTSKCMVASKMYHTSSQLYRWYTGCVAQISISIKSVQYNLTSIGKVWRRNRSKFSKVVIYYKCTDVTNHWTGLLDWNTYWTGLLDWNTYWTGLPD